MIAAATTPNEIRWAHRLPRKSSLRFSMRIFFARSTLRKNRKVSSSLFIRARAPGGHREIRARATARLVGTVPAVNGRCSMACGEQIAQGFASYGQVFAHHIGREFADVTTCDDPPRFENRELLSDCPTRFCSTRRTAQLRSEGMRLMIGSISSRLMAAILPSARP